MTQPELFPHETGETLRDFGMTKARDNADALHKDWSEQAYNAAKYYLKTHHFFMCEHIRSYANLPDPPSKRAWGCIMVRLVKEGLIKRDCFMTVANPKAHKAIASVWESKIYQW